jgi:ABC-type uncharacterized transport system substrate-binding protein
VFEDFADSQLAKTEFIFVDNNQKRFPISLFLEITHPNRYEILELFINEANRFQNNKWKNHNNMENVKETRNADEIIHRLIADKLEMEQKAREDFKKPHVQKIIRELKDNNKLYGNRL